VGAKPVRGVKPLHQSIHGATSGRDRAGFVAVHKALLSSPWRARKPTMAGDTGLRAVEEMKRLVDGDETGAITAACGAVDTFDAGALRRARAWPPQCRLRR